MLSKLLVTVFILVLSVGAFAQDADSLYLISKDSKTYVQYNVKPGETLFMLAKRFHCPPSALADANGIGYRNALKDSTTILIPLGDYNHLIAKPEKLRLSQIRRIFYKAGAGETSISTISRSTGVSKDNLQQWNRLYDNMIQPGEVFLAGWTLYDETQAPNYKEVPMKVTIEDVPKTKNPNNRQTDELKPAKQDERPKSKIVAVDDDTKNGKKPKTGDKTAAKEITVIIIDTSKYKTSETEMAYMKQTQNETKTTTEKGPVVFFDMPGGRPGNVFLGFHSNIPRGTIIKVFNPGTGKAIYVKVLGPLPETKQYYNSILGISSDAKEALGVKETRLWCELSFASENPSTK